MEAIVKLEHFCKEEGIAYQINEPLRGYTSFKIGGPADIFIRPAGVAQLSRVIAFIGAHAIPLLVMGKGSNMLISDAGVEGAVVLLREGMDELRLEGEITLYAGAGASLSKLCCFARDHALTGLEFAYGIPGSVGGGVYMNAGAYGGEMKDVLLRATHIDIAGNEGGLAKEQLNLSYRHSAYKENGCIITGAYFSLQKGDAAEISAKMEDILQCRKTKQPLEFPSAGSTFKRPVGGYASELIDRCGLKGCSVGGAMVSEKHAGFLINAGDASCSDVLGLIETVRRRVGEETGFHLECEVELKGRF